MSNNPYAFPMPADDKSGWHAETGMTLRDYFAGQALAGMLADHLCTPKPEEGAQSAYAYADAMLAERAKGGAA